MRIRQRHILGRHVLHRGLVVVHGSFPGGLTVEFGSVR